MAKNTTIKSQSGKEYEYFRITRTVGHRYKEGKKVPIKKQFVGTSERDAERKYKLWLQNHEEESVFDSTKTFGELAEFYTENILAVNSKYSIGTRELYTRAYENHIKTKNIMRCTMSEVKAENIQQLYNDLKISKSAMANVHKFMRGFMKWQNANKYGDYLLDSIIPEKPKNIRQEGIITWTDEELETIFTAEPDYVLLPLITIAPYSGMRISELLGLNWGDIYDDVIHVRRQFYRGSWCPPKGNKTRLIPAHTKIKEMLDHAGDPEDLIFSTVNGTPLDQKNINRSLDRFYGRIGIPHKKFHAYRATFITNLCKKGVPIQIVSKLAGHENINVTAKYYASVQLDELSEAVKKL